jgi:uncharacterized protein (DUF983 family)
MATGEQPTGFWGAVWAMLRQRCPRCRRGRMFRGLMTMNDPCPVCGLIFQREEGYFLGAMYVSYVLSAAFLVAFYFTAAALLPDWNGVAVALIALLPYLPLMPLVYRYSRAVWVHVERFGFFGDVSAGPYEKMRRMELERQQRERGSDAGGPGPVAPDQRPEAKRP